MGNRCRIVSKNSETAIYLQWNGGRDSVEAFLTYGKLKGLPGLNDDRYFGLVTIITNFFGNDGFNIYSESAENALIVGEEAMLVDNGTYVVDGWKIVDRICPPEVEQQEYAMDEMLLTIDRAQPAREQLGEAYLRSTTVDPQQLGIGDVVFLKDRLSMQWELYPIVGFGRHNQLGGTNAVEVPYVNRYGNGDPGANINNYLRDAQVRVPARA